MSVDAIDLAELSDILGTSNPSVIRPILEVWIETSLQRVEAMTSAVDAKDRILLQQAAHGAKGTALQIGAKQMAKMCAQIEDEVSDASWDILAGRVREILDEDERARSFAEIFLSGV